MHGSKVDLHLERLWSNNITITSRLVDTFSTPKTVQSRKVNPTLLITHHFRLCRILEAYDTFGKAASTQALKVIIETWRCFFATLIWIEVRAFTGDTKQGSSGGITGVTFPPRSDTIERHSPMVERKCANRVEGIVCCH